MANGGRASLRSAGPVKHREALIETLAFDVHIALAKSLSRSELSPYGVRSSNRRIGRESASHLNVQTSSSLRPSMARQRPASGRSFR